MVGSRHLQGTIISRIKHLLESGSLKKAPVWYDVVRRFPPPPTALLSLVAEKNTRAIPKMTYPIDDVKREFYKKHFRAARDPASLFDSVQAGDTKTEVFLKEYQKHVDDGCESDEALEKALLFFGDYLKTFQDKSVLTSNADLFHHHGDEEEFSVDLSTKDIYDIFDQKNLNKR